MKVAFVTCSDQSQGRPDDLIAGDLISATVEVWDDPTVKWQSYDRVVIRSTWDYTSRQAEFLAWCLAVGPERLRNSPDLVAWNSDKAYLGELPVPTVQTEFVRPGEPLPTFATAAAELVVKPNISAGARQTGRFTADARDEALTLIRSIHASGRTALIQPYLGSVDSAGETAIVFFGSKVSHVLHKKPVLRGAGVAPLLDGGGPAVVMRDPDLVTAHHATAAELELAAAAHAYVSDRFGVPLYLRVDMVEGPGGAPVVMELEAIEPSLYLGQAPGSGERFAAAILAS